MPRPLRRHAFVAVGSSWLLSFAGDGIRLVTMMVLARLLLPEDYGTFALATSVTGWLAGLGFSNFSPNILREKGEPGEVATYLLFGLALHGILAITGLGVAALLWYLLDRPVVGALVAIATLALPLQVPAQIEGQLLQREFRWRAVRLWQLFTMLAGSAVSILLAWQGFGPFALLAGMVIEPLPLAIVLLATRPLAPLSTAPAIRARLQAFGWPMVGAHVLWASSNLVGTWAVGWILGPAVLGLLNRASGLAGLVTGRLSGQLSYALLPVLARAQTDPLRRARAGRLLVRFALWPQIPLAAALLLLAEPAVTLVYGLRWLDILPLMPFVLALGAAHASVVFFEPMILASGRSDRRMLWEALRLCGTLACVPLLFIDLKTYLAGMTGVQIGLAFIAGRFAAGEGWLSLRDAIDAILPATAATFAGAGLAAAVLSSVSGDPGALAAAAAFTMAYVACLRIGFPGLLRELIEVLPMSGQIERVLLFARSRLAEPGSPAT